MRRVIARRIPSRPPRRYRDLIALFPLRPIRDDVDYQNGLEVVSMLSGLPAKTDDQADYFEVLVKLVNDYEESHHRIDVSNVGPIDALKFLLEQNGMNGSDLGRLLGQRQLGPAILRGDRKLSKTHIRKLSDHFGVSADVFLH